MPAIPGTPITIAGITNRESKKPPHPEHGNQLNLRHPTQSNAGAITIGNDAVTLDKMAGSSDAKIIIGDANDNPSYAALSGDVTMDNQGTTTIGADKVTTVKILDGNVTTSKIDDDAVTKEKINIDVAGDGLGQNNDGSLEAKGLV